MIRWALLSLAVFTSAADAGAQTPAGAPSMQCDVGPISKSYGGSNWLVYGCVDGQTLVFITPQGEPAFPFYFLSFPRDGERRLYGEGERTSRGDTPCL